MRRKRDGSHKTKDQKQDVKIARELGYSRWIIEALENEPDPIKRQHILSDARHVKR